MKILNGNKIAIGLIAISAGISAINYKCSYDKLEAIKNEIKIKDPALYKRLILDEEELGDISIIWKGEYDLMNDSLRLDSISKKAYFEGVQRVQDSIKKANVGK